MRISDWSSDVCSSDLGQAIGQFLLNAGGVRPSLPFIIASILISLAAIPVALTRIDAPTPSGHAPLGLRSLYAVSPLGIDRKRVVSGKSVSGRVYLGGRRILNKNKINNNKLKKQ